MFFLAPATCGLPCRTRHFASLRHLFCSSASKANEPTSYRGAKAMTLFITPCQCPTYVNSPLRKRPSRKKRYFQTNLTLGEIDKRGKVRRGTSGGPELTTQIAVRTFQYAIAGQVARRADQRGVIVDFRSRTRAGHTAREPTFAINQVTAAEVAHLSPLLVDHSSASTVNYLNEDCAAASRRLPKIPGTRGDTADYFYYEAHRVLQPGKACSARRGSCAQLVPGGTRPTLRTRRFEFRGSRLQETNVTRRVWRDPTMPLLFRAIRHSADTDRQEATRLRLSEISAIVTMPLVEDAGAPVGARFQDVRKSS